MGASVGVVDALLGLLALAEDELLLVPEHAANKLHSTAPHITRLIILYFRFIFSIPPDKLIFSYST